MKVELKPVVIPAPPQDVVITLSKEEAIKLNAVLGQISGGIGIEPGECRHLRNFTCKLFNELFVELGCGDGGKTTEDYEHWSDMIKTPMYLE